MSTAEFERRERIALGRRLYDGKWREVLIDLKKTQHLFRKQKKHDGTIDALVMKVNLFKLACDKHADILVLTPPAITIHDAAPEAKAIWERIAADSLFDQVVYEMALTCNIEGEVWIMPTRSQGRTIITPVDNCEIYVVGELDYDGQPRMVDRRWVITRKDATGKERHFLRVERHSAPGGVGQVESFAVEVRSSGATDVPETAVKLPLSEILGPEAPEPLRKTGADRPLLMRFVNRMLRRVPQPAITQYDIDLIDQVAASASQLVRTIAKHADPKVRIPSNLVSEDNQVDAASLEAFTDPDKEMEYIEWEAKLEELLAFLERCLHWLLVTLEMTPSLLGLRQGEAAESAERLMLESMPTITRAERVSRFQEPALERAIMLALMVEWNASATGFALPESISAVYRPGLSKSRKERSEELGSMKMNGLIDTQSAVEELHGVEQGAIVLQRLQAEQGQQRSLLLAEPAIEEHSTADAEAPERVDGEVAA